MKRLILLLLIGLGLCGPARAQPAGSPALRGRADQVVALLRGQGDPADMFTPAFLAQVPPAQIRAITRQQIAANMARCAASSGSSPARRRPA